MPTSTASIERAVDLLTRADQAFAIGRSIVDDARYDQLRSWLTRHDPTNPYLARVGDAVVGARERREDLPIIVGSLSKLRPTDVGGWMRDVERITGPQNGWLVTPKFDGQGVLLSYRGTLQRAWTRGRIIQGANRGIRITRAASIIQGVLPDIRPCEGFDLSGQDILVRGEVVMHTSIWNEHYQPIIDDLRARIARGREAGRDVTALQRQLDAEYSNPRNMCAGILNRLDPEEVRDDLRRCTFVALQLFRRVRNTWVRPASAHAEWVMLQLLGFTTSVNPTRYAPGHARIVRLVRDGHECLRGLLPVHDPSGGIGELAYWDHHPTPGEVAERLAAMRKRVDIRLDGLVVQPVNIGPFVKRGDHLMPLPSFVQSIKLDAHDQATLTGHVGHIEWRISKRGLLKPRLHLRDPLDFDGAEVTHVTLNNAQNVVRWGLRSGRPLRLVRSGDVIPRITGVYHAGAWHHTTVVKTVRLRDGTVTKRRVDAPGISDTRIRATIPTHCPDCDTRLRWNETRVDLWCDNEDCPARHHKRVYTFFRTLRVDDVADGTIRHLLANGMTTIPQILEEATPERLQRLEGYGAKKAATVSRAIRSAMVGKPLASVMHASGAFGNEVCSLGSSKLQDIVQHVGPGMIERGSAADLRASLARLKGIGPTGTQVLLDGIGEWRALWARIGHLHVATTGPATLSGVVAAFTNFRDAEAEAFIAKHGGRVAGLSQKTSVLFSGGGVSGKTRKADQYKIPVVPQTQMWDWLKRHAGAGVTNPTPGKG